MVKNCNVDSCTRFSVTQWMIGVAVGIMVVMQGYIINRVDNIEKSVGSIKPILSQNEINNKNNEQRIAHLESKVYFLPQKEKSLE